MASVSQSTGGLFYQYDNRVTNLGNETFNCSIVTKTYDFDLAWAYKVMFWWGVSIATSGGTTAQVVIPNAGSNYTWNNIQVAATPDGSWGAAHNVPIRWNNTPVIGWPVAPVTPISMNLPPYGRKFLKLQKKVRFRQLYFTITTPAIINATAINADSTVRIYSISVFLNKKEVVVRTTT
jgi:hypothetical protein